MRRESGEEWPRLSTGPHQTEGMKFLHGFLALARAALGRAEPFDIQMVD